MTTKKMYRARDTIYHRTTINLSPMDLERVTELQRAYQEKLGLTFGVSVFCALGLRALAEEVEAGHCRTHPDIRLSKSAMQRTNH